MAGYLNIVTVFSEGILKKRKKVPGTRLISFY